MRIVLRQLSGHLARSRGLRVALLCLLLSLASAGGLPARAAATSEGATRGAWGGGTLTGAELRALVAQMTLAEKVSMIHGGSEAGFCSNTPPVFPVISPSVRGCVGQAGFNKGVARLGIPPLRQTDGPAGVRLSHQETALPAPVGLTATFDRDAAGDYGRVIGREGRATNQDVLYAPMINQVSVPTAGRNFETLGEDPFLAGELVAGEVEGVQGEGLIATVKHYAQNDFENARMQTSIAIDEQALHELELLAFEKGIGAGAGAVMCAYSRVNDVYSCSNDLLLNQILRGRWGFDGWVLSDFGATHRLSDLVNGLDSAMPNGNAAVVLNTGDPVLMPWASSVEAIVEMWYPGQLGGPATADVLLGSANPSGKLPVTFPADPAVMPTASAGCDPAAITTNPPNDGNCPLYPGVFEPGFVSGDHSYKTIDYKTNGIFQGYRWYDLHGREPLFPFGSGLSYTKFSYSKLHVAPARDGGLDVSFRVRNTGHVTGTEVPQVYLGPASEVPADAQQAVRKLAQFARVTLLPATSGT